MKTLEIPARYKDTFARAQPCARARCARSCTPFNPARTAPTGPQQGARYHPAPSGPRMHGPRAARMRTHNQPRHGPSCGSFSRSSRFLGSKCSLPGAHFVPGRSKSHRPAASAAMAFLETSRVFDAYCYSPTKSLFVPFGLFSYHVCRFSLAALYCVCQRLTVYAWRPSAFLCPPLSRHSTTISFTSMYTTALQKRQVSDERVVEQTQ